jgi:ribosomal protein L16/L10AE
MKRGMIKAARLAIFRQFNKSFGLQAHLYPRWIIRI